MHSCLLVPPFVMYSCHLMPPFVMCSCRPVPPFVMCFSPATLCWICSYLIRSTVSHKLGCLGVAEIGRLDCKVLGSKFHPWSLEQMGVVEAEAEGPWLDPNWQEGWIVCLFEITPLWELIVRVLFQLKWNNRKLKGSREQHQRTTPGANCMWTRSPWRLNTLQAFLTNEHPAGIPNQCTCHGWCQALISHLCNNFSPVIGSDMAMPKQMAKKVSAKRAPQQQASHPNRGPAVIGAVIGAVDSNHMCIWLGAMSKQPQHQQSHIY